MAGFELDNQKITALWANNQSRNAWVYTEGPDFTGWVQFEDTNFDCVTNMLTILAAAKNAGSTVTLKGDEGSPDESAITEVYVW